MPSDLCCWQVRLKKKPSTTVRTFHTRRKGSWCFVLPATCPRGCLLFCDLRRSRVWSGWKDKSGGGVGERVVCGRTLGRKVGHRVRGWERSCFGLLGWTHRDCAKEPWVGYFTCSVLHSLQTCPELLIPLQHLEIWAGRSPAPPGMWGHRECWSLPYSKNSGRNHGFIESWNVLNCGERTPKDHWNPVPVPPQDTPKIIASHKGGLCCCFQHS